MQNLDKTPKYTVQDLANIFDVSAQTIRQWSIEFDEYLSTRANPGRNRVRSFSEEDLTVLSLISQMKGLGHIYEDIHIALANGQRGEVPDVEEAERRSRVEERFRQLQTTSDREIALANQKAEMALARATELEARAQKAEQEREFWQNRAVEAEGSLHQMEVNLARVQGEMEAVERDRGQLKRQQEQIDRLEAERNQLTAELMAIYRRLSSLEAQPPKSNSPGPGETG